MSTSGFNCSLLLDWHKEGKKIPYLNATEQDNTNCIKLSAQNAGNSAFCTRRSESWSVGRFLSFFRLHFPLNKADPLWGQQRHSYRIYMGDKGGSPHQAELIVIRIFRLGALSQQPTQTPHKTTADLHTKILFTQIFILSAASHKHTMMEKSTKAIQSSLALPLSEDQGLKPQISYTTTKAPIHKNSLCVSFSGDLL